MKILLIRPPDMALGKLKKIGGVIHPLNLVYLATYISTKHDVKILDMDVEPLGKENLEKYIQDYNPDIIGITVVTPHYKNAVEISTVAKKLGKIVVWGGPHATVIPENCLKNNVDIIIKGEGEFSFFETLEVIEKNKLNLENAKNKLKNVKGISYKLNNHIYHNEKRELCSELDTLPLPNRKMLELEKYNGEITPGITKRATQLFTSRGCPFQCTFCAAHLIQGRGYRMRSVSNIMKEVNDIYSLGFNHVSIDDDTFTLNRQRVVEFSEALKKDYPDFTWNCDSRVTVDYELLRLMKKGGCEKISFGVESGSQRILDVIKKGIKVNQVIDAFDAAKKAGIKTQAFMMIGHPTETKEDIDATIQLINKISPDYLFLSISTPYPGTELYEYMTKKGLLKSDDNWDKFGFFVDEIGWDFDNFTREEMVQFRNKIYRNYYLTPRYIFTRLKHLNNVQELKYYIKGFFTLLNFTKQEKSENS